MLLKDSTALRGPSGWEDEARNAIRNEAKEILDGREGRIYGDTMGNLYAYRKGTDESKPHVMLAAHMDEVGFIVRRDCSNPGGSDWGSATKDVDSDRFAIIEGKETVIDEMKGRDDAIAIVERCIDRYIDSFCKGKIGE